MSLGIESGVGSSSSSEPVPMEVDDGAYHINALPEEIIRIILNESVLSDLDKARAAEVCPLWSRLVEHRPHPEVTVYGKKVWKEHFGYQIQDEIPLPPPRVKVLETLHLLDGKLEKPGCILALMPKGLTFNKLRPLMRKPKEGHETPILHVWSRIEEELGDKAIDQTCWVLFTESVIEGSRSKSYEAQKALVAEKTHSLCGLPKMIVAVACVALKRAATGERILSDSPMMTYTRCEEMIDGWPLVVGGFSPGGLCVFYCFYDCDSFGVAACRKF